MELANILLSAPYLEGLAMLVLTLHIVFPVIIKLGLDPIWFGVVVVIVLEMGLISPPVGVNVFVVRSVILCLKLGLTQKVVFG